MVKRTEGANVASWSACGAVVLALLLVSGAHAQTRINECNSDITISQTPTIANVGQTTRITLTISSTDSRDNMDNPVAQIFDKAMYTGDCTQPPTLPCTPDPMATVMFQGNVGGTCMGMGGTVVNANPMGNGVVEFDFVPDLSLLIPAPATPVSCTVSFDVSYSAADFYALEAMTAGICQNALGSNSTTEVQTVIQAVGVPELTVAKACSADRDPATLLYPYAVTVENTGTAPLTNCVLTDPGATCSALSSTSLATMGATATATCTSLNTTNTASVTCDYDTGAGTQQIMRESEPAMCPQLSVTNECSGNQDPGTGLFPYTVTAQNTGGVALTSCVLTNPGATCGPLSSTSLATMGATATAACTSPDLTNEATVTCNFGGSGGTVQIGRTSPPAMCVPTLGEIGLMALALLLALGSWRVLRRRQAVSPV